MMRLWWTPAALLLASALTLPAGPAEACSCLQKAHPLEAYRKSTLAFYGRVAEVVAIDDQRGETVSEATFVVESVFKGAAEPGDRVPIKTRPLICGLQLEEGRRWLIVAGRPDSNDLEVGQCGHSLETEEAGRAARSFPREGEPYWDALFALEGGDLNRARELLDGVLAGKARHFHPLARKARQAVGRLLKQHEKGMGALERKALPQARTLLQQIETQRLPFLPAGRWRDEGLRKGILQQARPIALAALEAEDWPRAYRHARLVFDAGDEVEGRTLIALLEHRARPLYNQGSRLLRKRDRALKAEGRKLLKLVVAMTGPEWRLHESAKRKLSGKRKARPGVEVPKTPTRR